MKRILAFITAALMLLSAVPAVGAEASFENNEAEIILSEGGETSSGESIIPKVELDAQENVSLTTVRKAVREQLSLNGKSSLPSAYSSVTEGYISPVKDQKVDGTCWLFAGMATAEASYAKNTGKLASFSVLQMGNLLNGIVYDVLGNSTGDRNNYTEISPLEGGNSYYTMMAAANWSGSEPEDVLPFTDEMCSQLANGTTELSRLYGKDIAHLEEAHYLGYSTHEWYMDMYKSLLFRYGALVTAYFHDDSAYNSKTGAYFSDKHTGETNHEVAVVGWNDNYPASNFGDLRPEANGAWLVKNSWGDKWGTDGDANPDNSGAQGYFWLSYYDTSIDKMLSMNYVSADKYKYNYHFDGGVGSGSVTVEAGNSVASKYTVKGLTSDKESVEAIGFFVESYDSAGQVAIYADTSNRNPMKGEKLAEAEFSFTLPGYYTVKLDNPVVLSAGETFCAAVTFKTEAAFSVDMDTDEGWGTVEPDYTGEHSYYIAPNGGMFNFTEADEPMTPRIKVLTNDAGEAASENYKVTFDIGSKASGTPLTQIKPKGQDLRLQYITPTRPGCEFLGWTTQYRGETVEYLPGDYYKRDKDAVMYAVWDADEPQDFFATPESIDLHVGGDSVAVKVSFFPSRFEADLKFPSATSYIEDGKTVYYQDGLRIEPMSGGVLSIKAVSGYSNRTVTVEVADKNYPKMTTEITVNITVGMKGDLNKDNKVNSVDSLILKRIIMGSVSSAGYMYQADINGDTKINSLDSNLIKKIILGGYKPK